MSRKNRKEGSQQKNKKSTECVHVCVRERGNVIRTLAGDASVSIRAVFYGVLRYGDCGAIAHEPIAVGAAAGEEHVVKLRGDHEVEGVLEEGDVVDPDEPGRDQVGGHEKAREHTQRNQKRRHDGGSHLNGRDDSTDHNTQCHGDRSEKNECEHVSQETRLQTWGMSANEGEGNI